MKRPSQYLKMLVLGAIEFASGKTIRERVKDVSQRTFKDEWGVPRQFTWRTVSTWLYRYKIHGVTEMIPKTRADRGTTRKVKPESVLEAIEQVKPSLHGKTFNTMMVYRACIERGLLRKEQVAQTTFYRLVKEYDLLKPDEQMKNKKRLAFSKQYANEMWQADTMFGPFVKNGSTAVQTKLICFIDDASRVVCHGEFFFSENTDTLIKAFKSALYKRGVPGMLYVDNGSIYSGREITLICARLGCLLCHTPVRDGAAKGKVERFFRTVRENFLSQKLDLTSLDTLNRAFTCWVEDEYHTRVHSTLQMRPIDRFGMDLARIRFLQPNLANDELFYFETDRFVKKDNTFSIKNVRFEAPRDLRARKVQVRYNRSNIYKLVVYFKGQRMGDAHPVDFLSNDRKPNPNQEARP